jgi:hypothetical protein
VLFVDVNLRPIVRLQSQFSASRAAFFSRRTVNWIGGLPQGLAQVSGTVRKEWGCEKSEVPDGQRGEKKGMAMRNEWEAD